jgi:flagellar hook-associated protein 2
MASASISTTSLTGLGLSGLSSGLDTSGIVTKLMSIESQPQSQLKTQLTKLQTHTSALQSLNTAIAGIATTAKSALTANALNSFTATSSSSAASASASAGATAGITQFTVDALAQTQLSVTGTMADTSSFASADHTITLQVGGGKGVPVTAASASVDDMISAINKAAAGVSASKVAAGKAPDGTPQWRIQLSATTGGSAGAFSVFTGSGTDPAAQMTSSSSVPLVPVAQAQDAQITLYPGSAAKQTVSSSTNTFSALPGGLSVSVSSLSSAPVSVTVAADATAATTSAQALVTGLATVFSGIASASAITTSSSTSGGTSSTSTSGGVFTGDSSVRLIKDALLSAATGQDEVTGKSPSSIGIVLTKDGTVSFDQNAFAAAMKQDPAGTTAMYQRIAQQVADVASTASAPLTGTLSQKVTSEQGTQSTLTSQISDWDTRLATIQAQYETQFNAMEVALNALSSQSSYLTGQINGLTTNYQQSR